MAREKSMKYQSSTCLCGRFCYDPYTYDSDHLQGPLVPLIIVFLFIFSSLLLFM